MPAEEQGRFASTVPFYLRYREPYPEAFFEQVARRLGLRGTEKLLDVACGPAPLALGFARYVASCTGLDPEPGMIEAARETAAQAGIPLATIQARLEDLPASAGEFDLITIGRALHWLDRAPALSVFERIVQPGGAIVVCAAVLAEVPENPWAADYNNLRRAFSADPDERRYRINVTGWFEGFSFSRTDEVEVKERHLVTIEHLAGRALSYSTTSPSVLGNRRAEYEAAVANALKPFERDGKIEETISAVATIFRRQGGY